MDRPEKTRIITTEAGLMHLLIFLNSEVNQTGGERIYTVLNVTSNKQWPEMLYQIWIEVQAPPETARTEFERVILLARSLHDIVEERIRKSDARMGEFFATT